MLTTIKKYATAILAVAIFVFGFSFAAWSHKHLSFLFHLIFGK